MQNNTAVCTQQPTACHTAVHWKLSQHQYDNLQHQNIKFPFKLLSNFSRQFKVTLSAHNPVYRVMQEERSVFWELTVSVVIRKKFHMTICVILNGYRDGAVWISRTNYATFWFVPLHEEQSLKRKGGYMRWTVCYNFGSADCIQNHEDQLRRTTHNLCTQAAKCIEVDGGLSEHLLRTVTNLFMCNKFVI